MPDTYPTIDLVDCEVYHPGDQEFVVHCREDGCVYGHVTGPGADWVSFAAFFWMPEEDFDEMIAEQSDAQT